MKLRNKKTGIIGELHFEPDKEYHFTVVTEDPADVMIYKKLADLYAEWEDYEEPKPQVVYYIDRDGRIVPYKNIEYPKRIFNAEQNKEIGNYFETKEEAEKAVKKLEAYKRLKDKGFRFTLTPGVGSLDIDPDKFQIEITADMPAKWFCCDAVEKDLDICFGGEE